MPSTAAADGARNGPNSNKKSSKCKQNALQNQTQPPSQAQPQQEPRPRPSSASSCSSCTSCDHNKVHKLHSKPETDATATANLSATAPTCSPPSSPLHADSPSSLDLSAAVAHHLDDAHEVAVAYPSLDRDEWQVDQEFDEESLPQDTHQPPALSSASCVATGDGGGSAEAPAAIAAAPSSITNDLSFPSAVTTSISIVDTNSDETRELTLQDAAEALDWARNLHEQPRHLLDTLPTIGTPTGAMSSLNMNDHDHESRSKQPNVPLSAVFPTHPTKKRTIFVGSPSSSFTDYSIGADPALMKTTSKVNANTNAPARPNPNHQRKGKTSIGRWTSQEHAVFLEGLQMFQGPAWGDIARMIGTRTSTQVRTHAQKFFHKMARLNQTMPHFEAQIQKIKTRLMARGVLSKKQTVTPPSVVTQPNFSLAGIRSFSPPKKRVNNGALNDTAPNASSTNIGNGARRSTSSNSSSSANGNGNDSSTGSGSGGTRTAMKRARHQLHEQLPLHINTTDPLDRHTFDEFYSEDHQMGCKISPASLKSILFSSSPLGTSNASPKHLPHLDPRQHHQHSRDQDNDHDADHDTTSDPVDATVFSWPNDTPLLGDHPAENTSALSLYSSWQDTENHGSPSHAPATDTATDSSSAEHPQHQQPLKIIEDDNNGGPSSPEDSMTLFGAEMELDDPPAGAGTSRLDQLQAASSYEWDKLGDLVANPPSSKQQSMQQPQQQQPQHHHQSSSQSDLSTALDTLPSMNQLLYRPN